MARLGYLGPAIVVVGAAVAGIGAWYVVQARPQPGDVIAAFDAGSAGRFVLRREVMGERAFIERRQADRVLWQALIPHYAGAALRPAIAWGSIAVTVRVERGGRAEVFALAMRDGKKLGGFRLAPEHEPIATQPIGPITLTDHERSYELVGGADWHEIVGIDLATGQALWKTALGRAPISDGGIDGDHIWLIQDGRNRTFDAATGAESKP